MIEMMSRGQQTQTASSILCSFLLGLLVFGMNGCGSSGSSGGGTPPVSPVGSAMIKGKVSGTIIYVLNAKTNAVLAQTDTASLPGPPPFSFSFTNIPIGVPIKVFFFSAGETFPLYSLNLQTNVFKITTPGTIDLDLVDMSGGRATAPSGQLTNLTPEPEDPSPPPSNIVPPPATISVTTPSNNAQVQGPDVVLTFSTTNFAISNQNQAHLHVYLDSDPIPYEFFNTGPVFHNGVQALNAQWVSATQIRFLGLQVNANHTVRLNLATASHTDFVAPGIVTIDFFVLPPPPNPPTVNATSPTDGQDLQFGPVSVSFDVTNFSIQGQGQPQLHVYLDGTLYQFLNNPNQVRLNGNPAPGVDQIANLSFRFTSLPAGPHTLRFVLANGDAANTELTNSSATDIVNFRVGNPPVAAISVTSGTSFLSSPVRISFEVQDFTIGSPGNQHMRFTIDGGPVNDFYVGTGNDPNVGVQLNGQHTHFAHWISATSFDLFGLSAGPHSVRLALVNASNNELANNEAKTTFNYTVQQPPSGDLSLQSVLGGLNFPSALTQAPDGRVFFNELYTGKIRVVTTGATWSIDPTPFCSVTVELNGNEQGLLGLALDPAFSSSRQELYVYYSAPGPFNQLSKLTKQTNGTCTETPILTGLPKSANHNSGIIKFGPDGKLYMIIGDAENPSNAQNLDSLAGKVLRVNADGSAPTDNPFYANDPNPSLNSPRKKVYSLGHRNSFGLTFHPSTGDLWESENGPSGPQRDEVNRVVRGGNYGWDSTQQSGCRNLPLQFKDPIVEFPIFAPTGIVGIPSNSNVYPSAYQGNLLVAGFNDGTIRLVIANPSAPCGSGNTSVAFPGGSGLLISLMLGSDGYVYASGVPSSTDSAIYRVVPQH